MSLVEVAVNVDEGEESDAEEARERNEYEIEKAIIGFIDEPSIRHNTIPESDSENEGDGEAKKRYRKYKSQSDFNRGDGNLFEGQIFFNGVAFKEAVLDYVLKTGRNLKQYRYDKTKLGYSCVGNSSENACEWRIYCSVSGRSEQWQVKVFKNEHSCVPNGECEMMKVPIIARLFVDKIREEPEYYMPMKIEELIMERWKISVSRGQCQAARNKAFKWIDREYEEQFRRLRDYEAEIKLANPGSTVEIDTYKNAEGLDVFNSFYVCFECLKRSWRQNCRPLIGVDGCHLRGKMKGQFLVALGKDANNAIYPIAWAVVQVENTVNWLWFVQKIKVDLLLEDGDGFIMVSDRQKGLIRAVELELPKIEHRMCVRHIYGNLKAKFGKKPEMKKLIWRLAWSYNEAEYNEALDSISCYDSVVYEQVLKAKPKTWCRAFYKTGAYCEDIENNSTESFNSTIIHAREKPLVPMLETVARLAMVRIAKRSAKAQEHKGKCTPYVHSFLATEHGRAGDCIVHRSTNMMFEVISHGCSYRVSLADRTCTCMKWDITGVLCVHGYGVIMKLKLDVDDYVCHWFRTTTWRSTYTDGLTPMRGARFWPTGLDPPLHHPPEPPQPGRQKKKKIDKRKKGKNESPVKTKKDKNRPFKRVMRCKVCGQQGHNSRRHKKTSQTTLTQGSQATLTQG